LVLDLVMAGLGSLSAKRPRLSHDGVWVALEPLEPQHDRTQTGKVVQFRPAGPSGKRRAKAPDKAAPDAIQQAKNFMVARITRTDGDAATDVRALHREYVSWCEARGMAPKPTAEIGAALLHLFELAKIPISQKDGRPVALGIALKS
jgi:hypothetical protein